MRNAQVDMVNAINKKWVDPYLEKNTLSKPAKIAIGAAAGALILGPTGMVAQDKVAGLGVMGLVGAAGGALYGAKMVKQAEDIKEARATLVEVDRPQAVFANVIQAQQKISHG